MTLPKLRFSWRPVTVEGGRWWLGLFCFYDARAKSAGRLRSWRLVISLRGLLLWLVVAAVAGYFAGAGALRLWLGRHPYNQVTYVDLAWPPRWPELQQKRGQALILEGLEDFKNHKWGEGQMALRMGLSRDPANLAGRLELARFYIAINQRPLAKSVLLGGLGHGYPGTEYFQQICALAADGEDYAWWLSACDTALGQLGSDPASAADRKQVLLQKMAALMAAGRPAEVVSFADAQGENRSPMFDEFKVLALLKAGKPADAVAFLDQWRARSGNDPQIVRLQVRAFREAGRLADMEKAIAALCDYSPMTPQPYVYGIVQNLLADRREEAGRGLDDFLLRFGSSARVLAMLVDPLAEIGARPMLERLVDYARQQGFDPEPFQGAIITVLVDKGDWSQAHALILAVRSGGKVTAPSLVFWYDLMGRLCDAALDPAGGTQSSLSDFVRDRRLLLKTDRLLIDGLRRAGRPATARDLITFAQGVYPENATLQTWAGELDRQLAALQAAQPAVVLTKPAAPAPAAATPRPVAPEPVALKEDVFFERLAAAKKSGDFEWALTQVQAVRQENPDWLGAREDEIELEEIRLNGRLGDLASLHLVSGFYVNGDAKHSVKAAALARELYAAGCQDAALMLARELLRKTPDYPPAKRMLAEWASAKPASAPAAKP